MKNKETIVILDFYSQFNQLIARRVRECNVYSEVLPYDTPIEKIKELNPKGIIFTGGPASVYEEDAPACDKEIFKLGIPILGICYGMQFMSHSLGGKVEKGAKKEKESNNFKNSEKGENFDKQLNEKTIALKNELLKILPNIQKASNEAEINIKLVSTLIKNSTNANDFFSKAANSKKILENGRKISILDWLQKRGIPVPINKEINDKYSKDLTVASWNELFKNKEFLNSLNGYGANWGNFKAGLENLRTSEDFERFRQQFGKDFETEVNYFGEKFIKKENRKQKNNNGTGGEDNQEQKKQKTPAELAAEYIRKNGGGFPSVISNSCDGLPIGARKYSKAVRRRMNYALNKYL